MSVVTLFVESNKVRTERRFPRATTLAELHSRLEPIVGIASSAQHLTLHLENNPEQSTEITDATLATIPDYSVLHVVSTHPTAQLDFDDLSQVEKYEMPDDEYDRKSHTVRAFKRRHNIGRFADNKSDMSIDQEDEFEESAKGVCVGQRCEVAMAEEEEEVMRRRGCVRFVGRTQFRQGFWVGVEYDEPVGKNDGSVNGVKYFTCAPGHGSFVRPDKVTVGDFPEEDLLSDLEEM
ncbi:hypothetical protein IWW50_003982 [Coemansia erecta]|nr:hypothetical protein GGF43_000295 [Coemansia sp. RSA 2618]KAJ2822984.1 hypothetical protein IWW50_003982 [Coemansia erecta]